MPLTQEQRWDHDRDLIKHDSSPRHQRRAVVDLVGFCWGLTHGGLLSPEIEKQLLARIRNTCLEFDMDPPGGRDAYITRAAEPAR